MDYFTFSLVLSFVLTCIHVLLVTKSIRRRSGTARLPPGPYAFPVIGNILALGKKPHESIATLSKRYGPIMCLKLGSITTVVASSPKITKEVLQKHDLTFSSRAIPDAANTLDHSTVSILWSPASTRWRKLRKICKEYLFSTQILDARQFLRRKKVQELLNYVHESCIRGQAVDIGRAAFTTSLNLLSNTFFSTDLAQYQSNSSQEFKDIVWAVMELAGKPNIADYFPLLKLIDPQSVRRQMKFYFEKLLEVFEGIINQRLQSRASSVLGNDVLDTLLNLTKDNDTELSCNDIKHLLLDLCIAGTDTTSAVLEWAMAELMKRPEAMAKARNELEEVIGGDGLVQESDIPRLPYLQAVVKETFRLHPAAPFLVPHKAEADVEICGFTVPKNAQILVNVWAMGRDPSIWSNPSSFLPERFLEPKTELRGQEFEFIPFGAGRRVCPGMPLASRMVHLMLASLLHSFHWKLEEGMKPEDIDMNDKFGLALQKAMPLKAIAIKL
ncbi:cytochrome P450 76T24-like [Cornus florida]|uniref:cytochrome P450 76T24-like n=1 Tax=Cornus florida TaxID=4283 RepID=UPI00289B1D30|nr:cytochrome P450 76T24-like [Cornus florida]